MAERKKAKKKGKEELVCEVPLKPTKEEYAIAKYLRANLPTKKTKFLQHTVEFFTASKAIDMLMDSPWSSDKSKTTVKFTSRAEIVDYMDIMLRHKFFHRARRVPVTARDLRGKALKKFQEEQEKLKELEKQKAEREREKRAKQKGRGGGDLASEKSGDEAKTKKNVEESKKEGDDDKGGETDKEKDKDKESKDKDKDGKDKDKGKEEPKGPKRRIKLEMHLEQVFLDGPDAYVWIFDPTPWYYWILSIIVVLGAIALCLFPLWPSSVRKGVYYLSLAAAGFLIFIIGLALLRIVVFSFIWLLTFGRHHLWLLPNLTEDVGFFASFWPLFHYEYKGPGSKDKKKKKKGKKGEEDEEEEESSGSGSESEEEEEDDDSKQTDSERSKKQKKRKNDTEPSSSVPPSPDAEVRPGKRSPASGEPASKPRNDEDEEDDGSQSSRNSHQTDKEFEIISGDGTEEDVPDHE